MFRRNSKFLKFSIVIAIPFTFFTLVHMTNPIIFSQTYSHENIILRTAEPIEESRAQAVLFDSYDRITRSSLYKKDRVYNVHYTNNSFTKFIKFDMGDIVLSRFNRIKSFLFTSEFTYSGKKAGYINTADHYLNSYVQELDPYIITHEITHLMSKDAQRTPYHYLYYNLTKNPLEEGYAEIISNIGYEYDREPDFLLASHASWRDGTEKYTYNNKLSYDKYSYASGWLVYNLLKEKDFSEILKDWGSSNKIASKFLYNYLVENGYKKIEGTSTHGVLEGTWSK